MDESEERVDTRLLPRLTKFNWTSEFRDAFKEYALTCGEAGEIIISGQNLVLARPDRNMMVDPEPVAGPQRMFADNDRGDRLFEKYEKRYQKLMEGKKKLMSKLLMAMDKDVKDSLVTSPGYQAAYNQFDIHEIWNLTEQVVVGRGAISVYSLVTRLLKHTQTGAYNKYEKDFKDMVVDLQAQGNPQQVMEMVFNALFVLGLNQDQFKERLSGVYGARAWPDYNVLSGELHMYSESTERMTAIKKEHNDGKVSAFAVQAGKRQQEGNTRGCWKCGASDHMKKDCPNSEDIRVHKCNKCGKQGHLEKFCRDDWSDERQQDETRKPQKTVQRSDKGTSG